MPAQLLNTIWDLLTQSVHCHHKACVTMAQPHADGSDALRHLKFLPVFVCKQLPLALGQQNCFWAPLTAFTSGSVQFVHRQAARGAAVQLGSPVRKCHLPDS